MKSGREEIPAGLCAWGTVARGARGTWLGWWKPFVSMDLRSHPIALCSWRSSDALGKGCACFWGWVAQNFWIHAFLYPYLFCLHPVPRSGSVALYIPSYFPSQMGMCGLLFIDCDPLFSAMCSLKLCNRAVESHLKDLPFHLPPTFIFKYWPRVYWPVIQISVFCNLSGIYIVIKYCHLK